MNAKLFDKVIRVLFILGFVVGIAGMPGTHVSAQTPFFTVHSNENKIIGYEWTNGIPITVKIDDPATPNPVDYTQTKSNPAQYLSSISFDVSGYSIKPGDIVTVTDGTIVQTHTVTNLVHLGVDPYTDIIYGTAEPGTFVHIHMDCDPSGCGISYDGILVDQNGNWAADFSGVYDIKPGTKGETYQIGPEGNGTSWSWYIPKPNLSVVPDGVRAMDWPVGVNLTLTVDNPNLSGIEYTTTKLSASSMAEQPFTTFFAIPSEFQIQPGFIITITDGITTITYTSVNLTFSRISADDDTVSGTAFPGANLWVWMDGGERTIFADAQGNWLADFKIPGANPGENTFDILSGTFVMVFYQTEAKTGGNTIWANANNPSFYVFLTQLHRDPYDGLTSDPQGYEWPVGLPVTMTIDRPGTPLSPDFRIPGTSEEPWPRGGMHYWFNTSGILLYPGDSITVTNGETTITQVMSELAVMEYNLNTNQISGTAEPGKTVTVSLHDPWIERSVVTEPNGIWMADFSIPGDGPDEQEVGELVPGSSFSVSDGSANAYNIQITAPFITALPAWNIVKGEDFAQGADVTLTIDDPSTGVGTDITLQGVADQTGGMCTGWCAEFQMPDGFHLANGQSLTMEGGTGTISYTVSSLHITNVDLATSTVSGITEPYSKVDLYMFVADYSRHVVADQNGNWSTSFALPGNGSDEQTTCNFLIEPRCNDTISVIQMNGDNRTRIMVETTPTPPPVLSCQPGDTVSGAVYRKDGITPIAFADLQFEDYVTGEILFTAIADQNGQYACLLPAGDYRVWASAANYAGEYYLETGSAENATELQVTSGAQYAGINFTLTESLTIEHFTFNLSNPLLQDYVVRQAIALGTNRQRILNDAFLPNGIYGIVSNSIVGPGHWAAAPDAELTVYPYDPAQARTILESAGWIDRDNDGYRENSAGGELAFTFKTINRPFRVASSMIFTEDMADIGIRINPEYYQGLGIFLDSRNFDIAEFAWSSTVDDATTMNAYVSNDPANYSGYSNSTFDAAMTNAAATSSNADKLPYLIEAQKLLSQDLPILPLFTRYSVNPISVPTGSDITVSLESYLTVHFDQVVTTGQTAVISTDSSTFSLPQNFQLLGNVYDIGSSAQFTNAQVCFRYDDTDLLPAQESAIRLFHLESNVWADVTDNGYPDIANNKVCGTVTSFSPFAVMYANDNTPPVITWVGSINNYDSFFFSFVPPQPTCTATDDISGVDGACIVTGYANTIGTHTLIAMAKDNAGNLATESRIYTVSDWMLKGFYQPVDMNGIYNLVKGGSTVPFKFEIFAGTTELTDVTDVKSFTYAEKTCNANAVTDEIEITATGGTSLRYDTTSGQFIYNWKTPKMPGKCFRVTLITLDGSSHVAYFKLK
jgi:hypothetical protein